MARKCLQFVVTALARYQVLEGDMKGSFVSLGLRYNSKRNSEVDFGGGITRLAIFVSRSIGDEAQPWPRKRIRERAKHLESSIVRR